MNKLIAFLILIPNLIFGQLNNNTIVPTMDYRINETNLFYSPTFEISWGKLKDNVFMGQPIKLVNNVSYLDSLNSYKHNENDFKNLKYLSIVGVITNEQADSLNRLSKHLGLKTQIDFQNFVGKLVAYTSLEYEMQYLTVFERIYDNPLTFNTSKVNSFGISLYYPPDNYDIGKQVKIYDFKSNDDFIITIKLQDPDKELILAKLQPNTTLDLTYKTVLERISQGKIDTLGYNDVLQIPILDFHLNHTFKELINNPFKNKCCKGMILNEARQFMAFRMDEAGILFESESELQVFCVSEHRLIFDKPFLIVLKNKNSINPFFAGWINNSNCMEISN
jgi:hypothetical protein